jgi:hypothetical protein
MDTDWRDDVIDNIQSLSTVNLYELLEIEKTDDSTLIKKQYRKLALKYHPDKATNDSDKFELINLAYHILSDEELRSKYNDIYEGFSDFERLKDTAFHTVKEAKADDHKIFNSLVEQLNKKHGYDENETWKPEEIYRRKITLEDERSKFEKELQEQPKLSKTDFSRRFEENRIIDEQHDINNELVAYEGSKGTLSNCVFLNDFEQLYDDKGSLEDNFSLPTLGQYVEDNTSLQVRMKQYEDEGKRLADLTKTSK